MRCSISMLCSCLRPKARSVARATGPPFILRSTGASFGILGEDENCCGESVARRAMNRSLNPWQRTTSQPFVRRGQRRSLSAHPLLYDIQGRIPSSERRSQSSSPDAIPCGSLRQGEAPYKKSLSKKIVYHDPCYLDDTTGSMRNPERC